MEQLKLIKRILLFGVFVIPIYLLLLLGWGYFLPEAFNQNNPVLVSWVRPTALTLEEVKDQKNVDILFLGSSHAYRGFDIRMFRKAGYSKVFNLGTSAQTPIQTEILVDRYLKQLKPKRVIYEMNKPALCSDGLESTIDFLACDSLDWTLFEQAVGHYNYKAFNSGLYRLMVPHTPMKSDSLTYKKANYISGGYVETKNAYYKLTPPPDFSGLNQLEINTKQVEAWERTVQKIKESGAELMIVQAPVTKVFYKEILESKAFDGWLSTFGEYYNYNLMNLQLNDSLHFYDGEHLNQDGVAIFNQVFIENHFKR